MDAGDVPEDDLAPDELVDDLLQATPGPHNLSVLIGFFGHSDIPNHHRLFTDATFSTWVDIPRQSIVLRRRIPAERDSFGGRSLVWVPKSDLLIRGEVTSAGAEASFLTGALSDRARLPLDDRGIAFIPPDDVEAVVPGSPFQTPLGNACCGAGSTT